jgi:hypothetical protein
MREETPHETETTQITISDALRRRAQSVINDTSIDRQWRSVIRAAVELNDPWLAELVIRAEAGENIVDTFESLRTPDIDDDDSTARKIEALAGIICEASGKSAGALFVLMGTVQHSPAPEALANAAKHFAFTHCGELNLYGMVDAQLAVVEGELLGDTLES